MPVGHSSLLAKNYIYIGVTAGRKCEFTDYGYQ